MTEENIVMDSEVYTWLWHENYISVIYKMLRLGQITFNHLHDYVTNYDIHNISLTTTGASAVKESDEEFGLSMTWTLNLNGSWLWSTLLKVFVVVIMPDVWSILKKLLFGAILYDNWPYLPLSASSACKHWYRKHKLGESNNKIQFVTEFINKFLIRFVLFTKEGWERQAGLQRNPGYPYV